MVLKLRRFHFDGYKALSELTVDVPKDILFLIGVNGAGKSSILQALAFVRSFARGETAQFFRDRHWDVASVRPRVGYRTVNLASGRRLRLPPTKNFSCMLLLRDGDNDVVWDMTWGYTQEQTVSESVWTRGPADDKLRLVFSYNRASKPAQGLESIRLDDLRLDGSALAIIPPNRLTIPEPDAALLERVISWAHGITSLELLSPVAMRSNVRGSPKDIGARGERLTGFIAALKPEKRDELAARVSRFYPVQNIETVKKVAGWIDMRVQERFPNSSHVSPAHLSDGFLRILALCSIPDFEDRTSLVLLDEVEDGIEPHILPDLIQFIADATKPQIIVTSHSPLLVNMFDPSLISILTRRPDGTTTLANSDDLSIFEQGRELFGVGEMWVNTSAEAVSRAVEANAIDLFSKVDEDTESRVTAFASAH